MDISTVNTFISAVGFPIAMCCAMMYIFLKSDENHKNEVNALKEALSNNTNILAQLKQLLNDFLKDESHKDSDSHE